MVPQDRISHTVNIIESWEAEVAVRAFQADSNNKWLSLTTGVPTTALAVGEGIHLLNGTMKIKSGSSMHSHAYQQT